MTFRVEYFLLEIKKQWRPQLLYLLQKSCKNHSMAWSNRNSIAKQRTWFILSIFIPKTIPSAFLFLHAFATGSTQRKINIVAVRQTWSLFS